MADSKLAQDSAVTPAGDDGTTAQFDAQIVDGWRAGLGPHGGYLAAMLMRALIDAVGDERRTPRSLTIHFLAAPTVGPVRVSVRRERRGRSLSSLSARMEQDGKPTALALAAFSGPWPGPDIVHLPMPDVAPPDAERGAGTLFELGAPPFTRQITVQHRLGELPFSGPSARMTTGGWLGLAEPAPIDYPTLAFFTDALLPAPFMTIEAPAPAPTIDLTIHFRAALDQQPQFDLCLALTEARLVSEGFFEEDVTIWSPGGDVLAHSRQLAILLPRNIG